MIRLRMAAAFAHKRRWNIANEQMHYDEALTNRKKPYFKTAKEEYEWSETQFKDCNKCKVSLPLTCFNANTCSNDHFNKDGYRLHRGECIDCGKDAGKGKAEAQKIAKARGIPFKAPEGTKCELCGSTEKMVFDHDHVKMVFRGWLCDPCNRSMGCLGDDVAGMVKVINYLMKTNPTKLGIQAGELAILE